MWMHINNETRYTVVGIERSCTYLKGVYIIFLFKQKRLNSKLKCGDIFDVTKTILYVDIGRHAHLHACMNKQLVREPQYTH